MLTETLPIKQIWIEYWIYIYIN